MQIHLKSGVPDIRLNKTELRKLSEADAILSALAVYGQDAAADGAREALAYVLAKYETAEATDE